MFNVIDFGTQSSAVCNVSERHEEQGILTPAAMAILTKYETNGKSSKFGSILLIGIADTSTLGTPQRAKVSCSCQS